MSFTSPLITSRSSLPVLEARRQFLGRSGIGLGAMPFATMAASVGEADESRAASERAALTAARHFAPQAKHIINLFMHGGPSQVDLFDHKPALKGWHGQELPASVRGTQRLTGMTSGQASFPVISSKYRFAQHGQSGAWMSELFPHLATVADDLCRCELFAGAATGRARRSVRAALSPWLGPALRHPDGLAAAMWRCRSHVCGAGDGPQAARVTQRNRDRLGR